MLTMNLLIMLGILFIFIFGMKYLSRNLPSSPLMMISGIIIILAIAFLVSVPDPIAQEAVQFTENINNQLDQVYIESGGSQQDKPKDFMTGLATVITLSALFLFLKR